MGLAIGILIAILSVLAWIGIMFAGGMRTTGINDDDVATAYTFLIVGILIAAACIVTHYFPLHW